MLMMFGAMDNRRMCIGNRSRTRNRYFVTHEVRALEAQKTDPIDTTGRQTGWKNTDACVLLPVNTPANTVHSSWRCNRSCAIKPNALSAGVTSSAA
jgi:hypothetical protein